MINARGLSKRYSSRSVLSDITLDVAPGECIALTGEPGSGRRTLLRLLATLIRPSAGTIVIDGFDSATNMLEVRQRIGFADADCLAASGLRVWEHLRLLARLRGVSVPAPRGGFMRKALTQMRIDPDANVDALSRETRAAFATIAALMVEPAVLLIDEPFAGADEAVRAALIERLTHARRRGAALVVRTDDTAALEALAARVVRLESGRLAPSAAPRES
jgi:ABC-type multidrug transport system ATPase subunit